MGHRTSTSRNITPETRLKHLARFEIDADSGCWNYLGTLTEDGYGIAGNIRAHRLFYEHHVGPVPEGLHLDHLCRNRRCVNPAHLEPVTCRENLLRGEGVAGRNARKTECKRGHSLAPGHFYLTSTGGRRCKVCHALEARQRAARRRAAAV